MSRIEDNYLAWLTGQGNYRSIGLVKIPDFDDPVYVHTGIGRYTFDGNVYESIGGIGSIGTISENGKLDPMRITLSLSNIPLDRTEYALTEPYQNKEVTIYEAYLDDDNKIINTPQIAFVGYTGNAKISYGKTAQFEIEVINELAAWNKIAGWRYNDEWQQRLYTGDTGLQYIFDTKSGSAWRAATT